MATNFKPVTHVIFDLDGVILDTEKLHENAVQSIADRYGKKYTWDLKLQIMGTTGVDSARTVIQALGLPLSVEDYLVDLGRIYAEKYPHVDLMPGVDRLVRHLHVSGVPMAIATSSKRVSFTLKTGRHKELLALFHHVVCSGENPEVKRGKPHPDIFLVAASKFEGSPRPEKLGYYMASTLAPVQTETLSNSASKEFGAQERLEDILSPQEDAPSEIFTISTNAGEDDGRDFVLPELSFLHGAIDSSSALSSYSTAAIVDVIFQEMCKHTIYPSRKFYQIVGRALIQRYPQLADNCGSGHVLVFEDAPKGVSAALAAGMQVVMVPDPRMDQENRRRATLCVDSMMDFKPELFGMSPFQDSAQKS